MLSPHINVQRPSGEIATSKSPGLRTKSNNSLLATSTPQNLPGEHSATKPMGPNSFNGPGHRGSAGLHKDSAIVIQWKGKSMEKAPELEILTKNPTAFHVYSGDCVSKLIRLISSFCKNLSQVNNSALANFKPVEGRTDHTMVYVNDLAREYMINLKYGSHNANSVVLKTPSGTSIRSHHSRTSKASKKSSTSSTKQRLRAQQAVKNQFLKEFYEKSFRTLSILKQSINHFKTLIYTMTFSRYAEEELTESEARTIRGKTTVGSCIWLVALALQQMQEDPEMEMLQNSSKQCADVVELATELQSLVNLSLQTWRELLFTISILERMYRRTEDVFQKQTALFSSKAKPDSDAANSANLHIRQYRRPTDDNFQELRNTKGFDPYASLLTWNNKRHAPSRIMYITEYTDPQSPWEGFDPLSVPKKVLYLREIMNFAKLILESVRETVQKIIIDLQGHPINDKLSPMNLRGRQQSSHSTGISSYEEGIDAMEEVLTKKMANVEWNSTEIHEFFETDKIFLDDMDILVLGAAVSRAVFFEARHTMHVCYETCRLLDYREFAGLPAYKKMYVKACETVSEEHLQNKSVQGKRGQKRRSLSSSNQFEIGKNLLELRNVGALFRTSHYREIVRDLPLYTNRLGMTLQDAEMVFTLSSEKLLS